MHPSIHIAIWGIALFITGIAMFIERYPDTIAGYNALPDEKKKNVDLAGMAQYLKKGMLIVTWSVVPATYLTYILSRNYDITMWGMAAWLTTGLIIVAFRSRKFYHNKKRKHK